MLRGLTQTLCAPGPRDPTETKTELCVSISCGGTGQQWAYVHSFAHYGYNCGEEIDNDRIAHTKDITLYQRQPICPSKRVF